MEPLTARPRLLKQANLSQIRRIIKTKGTATRAEIAKESKISSTTVRALLTEMMENGEIESIGFDESSGGRKAERYGFRPNRYYSAVFCTTDDQIHSLLVNICGDIVETKTLAMENGDFEAAITARLEEWMSEKEIKAIGIGVPGVVEGTSYWKKRLEDNDLHKVELGERLAQKYGVPVVLENDLKAIAIGFGRCYSKEYPHEPPENTHMAYLHFENGCISAGFIASGRIVRGAGNFAGELGLVPMDDGRLLDEWLNGPLSDMEYTNCIIKVISWICAVLNPQYVVLGGAALRTNCIGPIGDGLFALLPKHMCPQLLYSDDAWRDYYDGMATLTAAKMFDDIQFIKE